MEKPEWEKTTGVHKPQETKSLKRNKEEYNQKTWGHDLKILLRQQTAMEYTQTHTLSHSYYTVTEATTSFKSNLLIIHTHNHVMIALTTYILVHFLSYLQG